MNDWFNKIIDGCDVERFHTMKLIHRESVGEHSFRCALFADYLYTQITGKRSHSVVMYMLLHDLPESDMGDTPYPAKKDNDVGEALDQFEEEWCVNNMPDTYYIKIMNGSELTDLEEKVCTFVDLFDAGIKFAIEYNLGNKNALRYVIYCTDRLYDISNGRTILDIHIKQLEELVSESTV